MKRILPSPLPVRNIQEAAAAQHRLVDAAARHLGSVLLTGGDLGLVPGIGRPSATAGVERTVAEFFGTEDCVLVRGAGTGALRTAFMALLEPGSRLVIHTAPLYPTTAVTVRAMGLRLSPVDFHNRDQLQAACREPGTTVLIQDARQRMTDHYCIADVIAAIREANAEACIITDESYAAMRVPAIGVELGADYSAFSFFKLGGPEGIGGVVGKQHGSELMRRDLYSGGCQVQGPEALDALRSMVTAPVSMAVQAVVVDEIVDRVNMGEVPGAERAVVASAQSRVAIVFLETALSADVIAAAERLGAATYPVGAESRYEVLPLFYRLSHTFLADQPELAQRAIRINPMRAGAHTVLSILERAVGMTTSSR